MRASAARGPDPDATHETARSHQALTGSLRASKQPASAAIPRSAWPDAHRPDRGVTGSEFRIASTPRQLIEMCLRDVADLDGCGTTARLAALASSEHPELLGRHAIGGHGQGCDEGSGGRHALPSTGSSVAHPPAISGHGVIRRGVPTRRAPGAAIGANGYSTRTTTGMTRCGSLGVRQIQATRTFHLINGLRQHPPPPSRLTTSSPEVRASRPS